jgi:Fe-S cluster assembly iron-binding protein IscA
MRPPPAAPPDAGLPDGGSPGGHPPAGGLLLTDRAAATIRHFLDQEGRPDLRVRAEVHSPDTAPRTTTHLDGFVVDFLDEPGRQGFVFDRSG